MNKTDEKIFGILRELSLFSGVDIPEGFKYNLKKLSAGCSLHEENGQGESRALHIIMCGTALVYSENGDGEGVLLRILQKGDVFGIAELFDKFETKKPHISRIVASGEAKIIAISAEEIKALLLSNERFLMNYMAFMSGRIKYLNKKIANLTAGTAEERLSFWLLSSVPEDRDDFELPISLSDLAKQLDIGRASLYRAFDFFESQCVLERNGKKIHIKDKEKLKRSK